MNSPARSSETSRRREILSIAQLSDRLAGRVDELVPRLLPAARRSAGYWHCGSVMNEKGDSLFIWRTGSRPGNWQDSATGDHGDLIDLAAAVMQITLQEAIGWAREYLGEGPDVGTQETCRCRQGVEDPNTAAAKREASEIWAASRPATGTLAETYLRHRCIAEPIPASIRFHPGLVYPGSNLQLPALVAAVSGHDRKVTAIQRIFLRLDGRGKAGVRVPKMTRGPMLGGAVRLAPAGDVLGLAEGLESAMSAAEIHGVPVWAALGSRLDAVAIPGTVRRLILFADNDPPGQRAAERAAAKHQMPGRQVEIITPAGDLDDWNDVAQAAVQGGV